MSNNEILKEACIWWMCFGGIALFLILCISLNEKIEKIDPENKVLKKIFGYKFYNFLKENL